MSRGKNPDKVSASRKNALTFARHAPAIKAVGANSEKPLSVLLNTAPKDLSNRQLQELFDHGSKVFNRWRNRHLGNITLTGSLIDIWFDDFNLTGITFKQAEFQSCVFQGSLNSDLKFNKSVLTDCKLKGNINKWAMNECQLNHLLANGNFNQFNFDQNVWKNCSIYGKVMNSKFRGNIFNDQDFADLTLIDSEFADCKFRGGRILGNLETEGVNTSFACCIFDRIDFTAVSHLDSVHKRYDSIVLATNDSSFKYCKFKSAQTKELAKAEFNPKEVTVLGNSPQLIKADNQYNIFNSCYFPLNAKQSTLKRLFKQV